jgi:hypothetical protein
MGAQRPTADGSVGVTGCVEFQRLTAEGSVAAAVRIVLAGVLADPEVSSS